MKNINFVKMKTGALIFAQVLSLSLSAQANPIWKQITNWIPNVNGPSDREHPLMFIPPNKPDEMILHGGMGFGSPQDNLNDLWSMNLKNGKWRHLNQRGNSPGPLARVAVNQKTKTVLVTGGEANEGLASSAAYTFSYEKNLATWSTVKVGVSVPRTLHALIPIIDTELYIAIGGISNVQGQKDLTDMAFTTILNLRNQNSQKVLQENLLESLQIPSARYGFVSAYDSRNQRVIVAVGQGPMKLDEKGEVLSEQDEKTYALDLKAEPAVWKELTNAKITGRRNPCWALDQNRNHLYVFGGTADGKVSIQGLARLNLNEENPTWEKLEMSKSKSAPLARSSCVAVHDSHRDRILFGFGNILNDEMTAVRPMTDLWSLELR